MAATEALGRDPAPGPPVRVRPARTTGHRSTEAAALAVGRPSPNTAGLPRPGGARSSDRAGLSWEGVPPPTRAPLSPEEAGLFELALRLSPRALIHILDDHRASFEAGTSFSSTLVQELRLTLEVSPQTAELAKKTEVSPEHAVLRLATLAVEAPATALALVARDVEGLKPAQLEAALASHGIDTSPARLAELSINEVYPGYFTVYDPKLAEAAEQAARHTCTPPPTTPSASMGF